MRVLRCPRMLEPLVLDLVRSAALLLAAIALGSTLVAWSGQREDDLVHRPRGHRHLPKTCQTLTDATVWVEVHHATRTPSKRFLLMANHAGHVALDPVRGHKERVYWDGQQLTIWRGGERTPRHIERLDRVMRDVWSECRSGFARSRWTVATAPEPEPEVKRLWLSLDLPFRWASPLEILIGLDTLNGEPERVIVKDWRGRRLGDVSLYEPQWTAEPLEFFMGPEVPTYQVPERRVWKMEDEIRGGGGCIQ